MTQIKGYVRGGKAILQTDRNALDNYKMAKKSIKRKISPRLAKRWVWSGKLKRTPSGLTKKDLVKNGCSKCGAAFREP